MNAAATGKSVPSRKYEDKELQRLQTKDYWLQLARSKLLLDLLFVCTLSILFIQSTRVRGADKTYITAYDVFKFKRGKRSVQTFSGLAAGLLR
jgi:hypothetical protein